MRMACCLVASVVTSQPVEILSSMVKCMRCLLHRKKKTFDVKLHNIFFFSFFFCGFVCAYLPTVTHLHQAQSNMFFLGDIVIHQNHTISCKNYFIYLLLHLRTSSNLYLYMHLSIPADTLSEDISKRGYTCEPMCPTHQYFDEKQYVCKPRIQ